MSDKLRLVVPLPGFLPSGGRSVLAPTNARRISKSNSLGALESRPLRRTRASSRKAAERGRSAGGRKVVRESSSAFSAQSQLLGQARPSLRVGWTPGGCTKRSRAGHVPGSLFTNGELDDWQLLPPCGKNKAGSACVPKDCTRGSGDGGSRV